MIMDMIMDSPGCRRCRLERPISGNSEHEAAEATRSDAYHIVETATTSIKQTVGYLLERSRAHPIIDPVRLL